jgi:hypothetical protein
MDGSKYDLSPLRRTSKPFSHLDQYGNQWFFNVCDNLQSSNVPQCPADAFVCKVPAGTAVGLNAGKVGLWSDHVNGPSKGVEIVYGDGDKCDTNVPRKTTFEFVCDEIAPNQRNPHKILTVEKVEIDTDKCYTVFTVKSPFACRNNEVVVGGDEKYRTHVHGLFAPLFLFFLISLIFVCCCACCARRRRNKQIRNKLEQEMIQFSNVTWQQPPQEAQTMPQYLQAPQYFVYPSVQVPIQQTPATLERESLLSADEQLAKELQAKFDSEAH